MLDFIIAIGAIMGLVVGTCLTIDYISRREVNA